MSRKAIDKAREIFDVKIQFVSLVDAAANKRKFLMAKNKDGTRRFEGSCRIVKADSETHFVTGVVYEPMSEDTQGDYMTAEEIQKAAYWFAKYGNGNDIQHSFERDEHCSVVESWVAKADFSIGNEQIKEGTWLMTVEIQDDDLWEKVQKGEITGFSMGGTASASEEETVLEEKKSLLRKFAEFLGIEKGEVTEFYENESREENLYVAWDALQRALRKWNPEDDRYTYETDESVIRGALEEFSSIVTRILSGSTPLLKAVAEPKETATRGDSPGSTIDTGTTEPVEKGEQETSHNEKEEIDVNKEELTEIVKAAVAEALSQQVEKQADPGNTEPQTTPEAPAQGKDVQKSEEIKTEDMVKQIVSEEIAKAREEQNKELSEMISKSVGEAISELAKANRLPSNLNGEEVRKQAGEEHYLKGIL